MNNNQISFDKSKIQILKKANEKLCLEKENVKNIIFIYCPPKVGSTSLVSSIRLCGSYKFKVIHIHDEETLKIISGITDVTINEIIKYNGELGRNVYVIDIYRTPLERKMSVFFDKLSSFHFNNDDSKVKHYSMERLTTRFNKIFTHIGNGDHYFEHYHDVTIPTIFDFDNKYLSQVVNNIHYIKLRLQDSNIWDNILTKLLGIKIIMIKDYETSNQELGDLYRKFKKEYKIPSNYIVYIEQCKYLNYYLSDTEQKEYIDNLRKIQTDMYKGFGALEYKTYSDISTENQWKTSIQYEHYFDEGCTCRLCTRKRRNIFSKLQKYIKPNIRDKIIHKKVLQENNETDNSKDTTRERTSKYPQRPQSFIRGAPPMKQSKVFKNMNKNANISSKKIDNNLFTNVQGIKMSPW
jgi:hypothetical protein